MGDFEIFRSRIKILRNSLGMTQTAFSEHTGIKQQTLSGYERGLMKPPLDVAKNIADKCHVSLDWLCGLSEIKSLTKEIETYSDLYKTLLEIERKTKIVFETIDVYEMGYDGPIKLQAQAIYFDNPKIGCFLEEWSKMKSLYETDIIDDDVYNLWVEKTLSKYENSKLKIDGNKFGINVDNISEELPLDYNTDSKED